MKCKLLLGIFTLLMVDCKNLKSKDTVLSIKKVSFSHSILQGLAPENGVCRRDPSDIIKVGESYYLWYTKTEKQYSGYDASIWYAVSTDGAHWQEKGEALSRGKTGRWDEYSVFTPNILRASGKYYLYYTAVKPTPGNPERKFENNAETDITAIGLAVSDSPEGPFVRVSSKPVLEVSENSDSFDSYRVDDACLIFKNHQYYLYYKGRSRKFGKEGPRYTKLGVAIADKPEGPYVKYKNNPIISSGHEVMVWPYRKGIMALLSDHGLEGKTLQHASDGIHFRKVASFGDDYPKAPGSFRIGNFEDASQQNTGISWGISMFYGSKGQWPHLLKYEINIE